MNEEVVYGAPSGRATAMSELFNRVAREAGKTTISQFTPDGAVLVWVTPEEADPLAALMTAALGIMVRRGINPDAKSGVSIRKVMGLKAPGCDYHWTVTSQDGEVIASGYAKDEQEASARIAEHIMPGLRN